MAINHIKCAIVGDGDVGKTSLLLAHTTGQFTGDYVTTEMDTYNTIMVRDSKKYKLVLVDTAGQHAYDRLRNILYRDVEMFIICFSLVNPISYTNVVDRWHNEISLHHKDTPCLLVGTKSDLRSDPKTVENLIKNGKFPTSYQKGLELKRKIKAKSYSECSSLAGEGVAHVFEEVIDVKKYLSTKKNNKHKFAACKII